MWARKDPTVDPAALAARQRAVVCCGQTILQVAGEMVELAGRGARARTLEQEGTEVSLNCTRMY